MGIHLMNIKCILTVTALVLAFTAVNLFLPYAVALLAIIAVVGLPCKLLLVERGRECRLGTC